MWPSQDTGLWDLGQGDQETREGQCSAGNTVRMRVPLSRTQPGGHTDDLLEAQATSAHLWKQARMWAAFKLTLLIPEDRQIIKIKQVVQNESTTKLASSWPTPWQRGGHQELEGLTCEKKNKGSGIRIPSRRAEDVFIEAEGATALGSPGSCYLCPARLCTDLINLLKTTTMPSILSTRTLKLPSGQESWYQHPLRLVQHLDIVITILCWHPTKAIVINSMFHSILEQKIQNA